MKLHTFIFGISVVLIFSYAVFLGIKFPSVPETIPIHYSSEGADGFGNKIFLWFEAGINAFILCIIGFLIFYPQKMVRKDDHYLESSAETAVKNRQVFLSVLSLIVTLLLCILTLKEII
ncbi:DUF1648 domain-containing protein [Chryseobacterium sp. SSA4.19]|uniref:DUF1648 domain-containing protein n=1 Tax=Chryseobacterium sp. SSA4.19 TaxID=2919915 RepID=UPI001F4E2E5C|nr:DUF1648 domain-containing protein [Chryseobacterium sp. SSA4.19]MCJ8154489.1 DUF1648 domain-containing protein [Chryseobacterium sp. SSA4.19]